MIFGISNGDGTYNSIGAEDTVIGKQSDLPNPQKSITENVKELSNVYSITQADMTIVDGMTDVEIYAEKQGNVVSLNGRFKFTCGSAGSKLVFTLPSGWRPRHFVECAFYENSADLPCAGRVNSSGATFIYSTSRNVFTNTQFYVSTTYFV